MKQCNAPISVNELTVMSERMFGGLVKAVVDLERNVMVVDASMHADEERMLLELGSKQNDLWGINLYPELYGTNDFVEFDSMINIRPRQNNFSRSVEDVSTQQRIISLVNSLITS